MITSWLLALPVRSEETGLGKLDLNSYMEGRHVFERNCTVCHGARGDGKGELAETLQPMPRSFREGMFKFRTTPWGALPTDEDLRRTITGGLSGTAMGMFSHLSGQELESVIVYVKAFSRRWRKAENYAAPLSFPPQPAWFNDPRLQQDHVQRGQQVFTANCMVCHGATGDGKGEAAAALKDIWGAVAVPSDLRQPHLRCGDAPSDIYRILATGLNGTPMVSFDAALTEDQRWDVIAYILSIRLPAGPVVN